MEKEKAERERKEREAFEKAAVEKWQIQEAEKAAKAKKEKEEAEKELRRQMRERLLASGYHEREIQAILDGKKPAPMQHQQLLRQHPHQPPPPPMHPHALVHHPQQQQQQQVMDLTTTKTTYTRMARKHLSIEALRSRAIEYELDVVCFSPSFFSSNSSPHPHFSSCITPTPFLAHPKSHPPIS